MRGMKPAFALDFRNEAIALLHRTGAGWQLVGRVTFDDPDMPAALSYLRATALGLDPRGIATKLILPDEQVLYTTLDAPGPDDASRAAQIRAGLQGRTPYAIEDLIFDYEVQSGEVRVAVIARETLAEAEGFAVEHRFNPVSFVAAPASGFAGEPWFGLTALAPDLIGKGETVDRDGVQVVLVERGLPAETAPALAEMPEDEEFEDVAPEDEAPEDGAGSVDEPEAAEEPEAEFAPETEVAAEVAADHNAFAPVDDAELDLQAAVDQLPEPDAELPAEAEVAAEVDLGDALFAEGAAEAAPFAEPAVEFRDTPAFGVADDEPAPSQVFAAAKSDAAAAFGAARQPAEVTPDLTAALQDAALQDIVLEEAPMAVDVEDDEAMQPQGLNAELAAARARPTDLDAPALDAAPAIEDAPSPTLGGQTPALGFASRRASANPVPMGKVPPPVARPAIARPTAAKPIAPVAPKAERQAVSRPTAAKPVVNKVSKGLRGIGALVSAPSLPNLRSKRVDIPSALTPVSGQTDAAAVAKTSPAGEATFGRNIGRRSAPVRGKPRYLGLALTMLLLLALAVIAAWSTTLAFRNTDGDAVQTAAADSAAPESVLPETDVPAAEDEMAADGLDPDALIEDPALSAEAEPESEPEAVAETAAAPAITTADSQGAATPENPGAASGDEIFLAAKDQPPPPAEPVALPEVTAQGDPVPVAGAPPPPFGTVYQFDANGLIVPTPEGIVTPEGVLLIAGKPPRVPAPRPALVPALAPEAVVDPAGVQPGAALDALTADPALAGFRPKARPATLSAPALPADDAALPGPETALSGFESRLASLRPMPRPKAILEAGELAANDNARAAEAAAAASLAAGLTGDPEDPAEPEVAGNTSKLAVAISRKPQPRPRDLSRAVEAAVAAAVRNPEPETAPEPAPDAEPEAVQTASLQPKPKPKPAPEPEAKPAPEPEPAKTKNTDAEADDEPELPAAKVGKVSGSVAKQATFKNALNLSKTALIGVYGTPAKRYAMIRTSSGRYKKVRVGDSVDGGQIKAITASEVRYQKGAKLVTLAMPNG